MCCNLIAQEQAGRAGARAWGGMGGARSWGTSGMGSGRRGGIRTCMTVARRSTGAAAGCPGPPGCAYSSCTVSPGVQGACCQPAWHLDIFAFEYTLTAYNYKRAGRGTLICTQRFYFSTERSLLATFAGFAHRQWARW